MPLGEVWKNRPPSGWSRKNLCPVVGGSWLGNACDWQVHSLAKSRLIAGSANRSLSSGCNRLTGAPDAFRGERYKGLAQK